ncbi:MAG: hypothetical protein J7L14_02430, partial [Candidatus Diapherotrites archaeon]|nr:hypothetical protein [Candidatus Diapherotrites archaeon]
MPNQMRFDDEIRLNILESLLKPNSVVPNLKQIKRYTGYHLATIKSSLEFLKQKGILTGFGPKINFKKLGYSLEAIVLMQIDFSQKEIFNRYLEAVKKDPHIYMLTPIIGGNWNMIARFINKDVESHHRCIQENYLSIPGIYKLIKNQQIFYDIEPHYK